MRSNVRTSGCSPEIIQSTLSKLAVIGTDYIRVNKFANHHNPAGGLVLQAFRGALQNLLHCYRAVMLSVDGKNKQFSSIYSLKSFCSYSNSVFDICFVISAFHSYKL